MFRASRLTRLLVKEWIVVIGVVVSVCISPVVGAADARPVFALVESSFDFGTVAQGAKVVHEFDIKNTGTADLVIQRLSPSCGCTATQIASPIVKPGAAEKVRVSFDTTGFIGEKTKTVLISTNDTEEPEKIFTLKGKIVSGFSVEPSRLDFGEVSPSMPLAARQKEVTFSVAEGSSLRITKVTSLSNYLVASPVTSEVSKTTVKIEILPTAPKGEFRDRIIFELEGGRRASVNVPVNASVKGDLRLNPGTVSFGVVEGEGVLERRIQFENKGAQPVTIQSITTSDPALSASMVQVQPGRQGVLVIKLDARRVSGDMRATVDVQTNHPSEPLLSVNVFGVQPSK